MDRYEVATFGGGCFWCVEAVVQRLNGVISVESGYSAGHTIDPDYRSICSGTTGHAEVVQIKFDPSIITYKELLTVFMTSHDPTTLNRQGADRGTQYRSIILTHDENQMKEAKEILAGLKSAFDQPIVTEVQPIDVFYPAEKYHQDYYNNNGSAGYCRVVIDPKVRKLREQYANLLKVES